MNQQILEWAKQALEMLNDNHHLVADNEKHAYVMLHLEVIEKGKAMLEQPEPVQEPVAWMNPHGGFLSATYIEKFASGLDKEIHNIPLYTTPPAQPATEDSSEVDHGDELTIAYLDGVHTGKKLVKRVPLTDEQIDLLINGRGDVDDDDYVEPTGDGFGLTDEDLVKLIRRVEKHHGIEGTP